MSAADRGPRTACRVSTCVRYWVLTSGAGWVPGDSVTLVYDPAEPYAVQLVFVADMEPWRLDRDLLAAGLVDHAGFGDIRLWPATSPRGEVLRTALSFPDFYWLIELPAPEVRRFLDRTHRQVPRGTEANHLDLDGLVARLLAETP